MAKKFKSTTIKNMKFIDSESLYDRFIDKHSMLVKIHDKVDFSFVNELCEGLYSKEGQHAYLPELVFRVCFIQFYKKGLSDNEIVKQCETNLEYRYFCNLAIDDELFNDCKLSRFRKEIGAAKFKEIFDKLVEKIKGAGFLDENEVQYLDSFLFLADVKIVSINALISKAIHQILKNLNLDDSEMNEDYKKRDFELSEDEQKNRFVFLIKKAQKLLSEAKKMELTEDAQKSIDLLSRIVKERAEIKEDEIRKKENKEEKDKVISVSDPDARMMGKSEQKILPSFKSHVAMSKKGFITYTDVTHATVYDGEQAYLTVSDLKSRGFKVPIGVGDTHYGDIDFRKDMGTEGTLVVAPYRKNQAMASCMTEDVMIKAWEYNHTDEYKEHRRIRAHIEPKQGEMKNLHGMKRAMFRGIEKIRSQNYMSAIVTNCKHLVSS
jgi:transposase